MNVPFNKRQPIPEDVTDFDDGTVFKLTDALHTVKPVREKIMPLRSRLAVLSKSGARSVHTVEIAEVEAMFAASAFTHLWKFSSLSYSSCLLFHREDLLYYVTLYQNGSLWRALRVEDFEIANAAFKDFEEQAKRFAEDEMQRTQLEAHNALLASMIAASEAEVERLRTDRELHTTQSQIVARRQQEVSREVARLDAQRVAAQAQLTRIQRHIQQFRLKDNERVPNIMPRTMEQAVHVSDGGTGLGVGPAAPGERCPKSS
ncbi:DUF2968 domain-containing protein [Burkholderia ubonensis]|uniref:DUF2968 domain-containing protein n=1 Tax=Burkholderia ubonensis TaxID=101571 RepID=UPI000B29C389|nr:DUF2968 domain-containing protein [Burkholderia ubonensis]